MRSYNAIAVPRQKNLAGGEKTRIYDPTCYVRRVIVQRRARASERNSTVPLQRLVLPGLKDFGVISTLIRAGVGDALEAEAALHLLQRFIFVLLEPTGQVFADGL